MQNGEGGGGSAHGCSGAVARQGAQEMTDLDPTAESICEQLRALEKQHAVIVCLPCAWFALVRLMRMCAWPQ